MKSLKSYISEASVLGDIKDQLKAGDEAMIEKTKEEILEWLKQNYCHGQRCKISKKPNKQGLFEVSCRIKDSLSLNRNSTSLTNGKFVFSNVTNFKCSSCPNLTSLEGAPTKVEKFECFGCDGLTSLEGAPKEASKFYCNGCDGLTSLEGAPKEVDYFTCYNCTNLTSLKGAPKKVNGKFSCSSCIKLTSLKGGPDEVHEFVCSDCTGLNNLNGLPKLITGGLECNGTNIRNFEGISELKGYLIAEECPKLINLKGLEDQVNISEMTIKKCENFESLDGYPKSPNKLESTRHHEGGYAGGNLDFTKCPKLASLAPVEKIGGCLVLDDCASITTQSFSTIKDIGGWVGLKNVPEFATLGTKEIKSKIMEITGMTYVSISY